MWNELITAATLLLFLTTIIYKAHIVNNGYQLFTKEYSTVLKGICCIIVVLVHIPAEHSTRIQNSIGSFAYVAVTLFFLLSGYGLNVSRKKNGYLDTFWRRRIPSLVIPMVSVNVLSVLVNIICKSDVSVIETLFTINGFTLMLGLCYLAYYFTYNNKGLNDNTKRVLVSVFIIAISIGTYTCETVIPFTVWPVPCLGFMYGVIIADYKDKIISNLNNYKFLDMQTFFLLAFAILIGGGYIKTKNILFFGDYIIRALLAVILILLLVKITSKVKLGNKILYVLGSISYEIYLSHGITMRLLDFLYPELISGLYISITLVGTIFIALCLHGVDNVLISRAKKVLIN